MVQRTVALCDGKYIGIETIYSVIDGKQISIPDRLKELREKSDSKKLYCPCGCGTNLILVAGKIRKQHFRENPGTSKYECTMPTEGKISIDSKIVLKCWLDDKLRADDIESRVPIDMIEDTKRKPEFTFISRSKKLALRYWKTCDNIMEDKLDVLTGNISGVKVIYIVDYLNGGTNGQYPEALMKLQDKQGFCLLLEIKGSDYNEAKLSAVFYEKNLDGLWKENEFVSVKLNEVEIIDNSLYFSSNEVDKLLGMAKDKFAAEQQAERVHRNEEERLKEERLKQMREEQELRRRELQRQREDEQKRRQQQIEESEERRKEIEKQRRIKAKRLQEEKRQREEKFKRNIESNIAQQEEQVIDAEGNRWLKCKFCGKCAKDNEFASYGGSKGEINIGICYDCERNNPKVKELAAQRRKELVLKSQKKNNTPECVCCGGRLQKRSGPHGSFYGCVNYPGCKYTRPI